MVKNHWAILIGINQYECFQPLRYAQADAQGLRNFLVDEAKLSPDRCLLLTDTSPPLRGQSTYPNQENIQRWLEDLCHHHLQTGDLLWLFFSGYGISAQGKDYLMPIEGDPTRVAETGISMKSLFEHVKAAPAEDALVLLDMNRSQGSHWGGVTGNQTVELARKLEVTTILSAQLDGFSHETSDLKHGFFTAAFLEGLRYNQQMKLETLNRYLTNRVPELSENHSRPEQQPLIVAYPPEKMQQIVFSYDGESRAPTSTGAGAATASPTVSNTNSDNDALSVAGTEDADAAASSVASSVTADKEPDSTASPSHAKHDTNHTEQTLQWPQFIWSSLAILMVLLGALVFWRHFKPLFKEVQAPAQPAASSSPDNGADEGKGGQSHAASSTADPGSQSPEASPSPISKPETGSKTGNQAQGSSASGSQAGQALSGQAWLDKAQEAIRPTQASYYSQAIAQAKKIRPEDPLYEKAQQNIERWSWVMIDIAQGRAKQGDFVGAIAAAKLVPPDLDIAAEVKQSIGAWRQQAQQQQVNRKLLQTAQQVVKPSQASTYNRAIAIALKIPQGQPEYFKAQRLIAEWSQTIYKIAHSRARQGQLDAAVQTVELVPPNTAAYASAQRSMSQWREALEPE